MKISLSTQIKPGVVIVIESENYLDALVAYDKIADHFKEEKEKETE